MSKVWTAERREEKRKAFAMRRGKHERGACPFCLRPLGGEFSHLRTCPLGRVAAAAHEEEETRWESMNQPR